ncbi:MAG: glycosyltransferase [Selenomonas sp.]|nr:glycosyltransferase [Selenomonas sp.]
MREKERLRRVWRIYKDEGLAGVLKRVRKHMRGDVPSADVGQVYEELQRDKAPAYMKWLAAERPTTKELDLQRTAEFQRNPFFSIVVPTYKVKPVYLEELVESLLSQTYAHWELLLADGGSSSEEAKAALSALPSRDSRIHVMWLPQNQGISGNTNQAIQAAQGDYIAFSDHDDFWEPDALYWAARAIDEQGADLIYTDEDKVDEQSQVFYEPHLKPDYSPETLCSANYINHLTIVSRHVLDKAGLLNPEFDGSQDHELVLRVVDATVPEKIVHVPRVLYHWRQFSQSMSKQRLEVCQAAGRRAVSEHLVRIGQPATILQAHGYRMEATKDDELVSVIFASELDMGNFSHVWRERLSYPSLEFVQVTGDDGLYGVFNEAASRAGGKYLLFVAGGSEPMSSDLIQEMMVYARKTDIGAVGGKIFLPDGQHIYATDYILGDEPKLHFYGHHRDVIGKGGLERMARNVSALPLALLMVRRELFFEVGGFKEDFQESFGEIDFCLRLLARNKRNVFTPFAELRLEKEPAVLEEDKRLLQRLYPQMHERYYGEEIV